MSNPLPHDPWANISEGMRCKTCMYFCPKDDSSCPKRGKIGRCRRNAPTMKGFPVVFETDWCGDHKLVLNSSGSSSRS